jgi:hypothetical protein
VAENRYPGVGNPNLGSAERNLGSNQKFLGMGIHLSEQFFGRFGSF